MKKLLVSLCLCVLLSGCRSWPVRWVNDNKPIKSPYKWECLHVGDDLCIPYLECWE